jgi:YD repeat-containing protein
MPCKEVLSIDIWQFRVRTFGRLLVRDWAFNQVAAINKEKTQLAQEYDASEKLAEERELDDNEKNRFSFLENKLANI